MPVQFRRSFSRQLWNCRDTWPVCGWGFCDSPPSQVAAGGFLSEWKVSEMSVELVAEREAADIDGPGDLTYVTVNLLNCDSTYQRPLKDAKARRIANHWEWRRCGALIVETRDDGTMWVVDGQHRLAAARIAGIFEVPCVVFASRGVQHEAADFLGANVDRKPLNSRERYIAAVVANEPTAQIVQSVLAELGMQFTSHPSSSSGIACVGQLRDLAKEGRDVLKKVLFVAHAAAQTDNVQVDAGLLKAIYWLSKNMEAQIDDPRFLNRVAQLGARVLQRAGYIAVELSGKGGDKVRGLAMLAEVNKGLRNKFTLKGGE